MEKESYFKGLWAWFCRQFFHLWTAIVVLCGYGYLWINNPEHLTWWKRTINHLIEQGATYLPYPWGDRLESTLGNFGAWIQIALLILSFRIAVGFIILLIKLFFRFIRNSRKPKPLLKMQ